MGNTISLIKILPMFGVRVVEFLDRLPLISLWFISLLPAFLRNLVGMGNTTSLLRILRMFEAEMVGSEGHKAINGIIQSKDYISKNHVKLVPSKTHL